MVEPGSLYFFYVVIAFRKRESLLLKAVAGAQRPEEANWCLQEARKSAGECSLSQQVNAVSEKRVFC